MGKPCTCKHAKLTAIYRPVKVPVKVIENLILVGRIARIVLIGSNIYAKVLELICVGVILLRLSRKVKALRVPG